MQKCRNAGMQECEQSKRKGTEKLSDGGQD
jgi:hypothetical protein